MKTMEEILEEYRKKKAKILEMGGAELVEKQHRRGKMTARERIEYFFDESTFLEIGMWVKHRTTAFGLDKREIPAEGVITGIGKVNGRKVAVAAEDYTAMAGTFGEYHGKKFSYIINFARDVEIPFVGMNDSGGARLQEGMDTLECYGWCFRDQDIASGVIPQIALLMGPCLGGQAYHPIMQDFLIQVEGIGYMGIAGPAFVNTQTGEEISLDKLCGIEAHAVKSGQTDVVTRDEKECIDKARELLGFLPSSCREKPPRVDTGDDANRKVDGIENIPPIDHIKPYDMHLIIEQITDNGYFFESKAMHAPNVITGFARFDGRTVGIVANNPKYMAGGIDVNAADKIARFVRFCDLFNIPLLNIHDTPGYWIGSEQEWRGILRHGSKTLYAYNEATVPKVTLIVRKSFAGAYLGMCSKSTGADIVFAWPNARVTIVGPETAASVIFAKEIAKAENPEEVRRKRIEEYEEIYCNPYKGAERGYIDDIIEPADSRRLLCMAFDVLETKVDNATSIGILRPQKKYQNINM
jgi:acetyl-CoA carboxylase carboxyltransferase component